MVTLRAYVATVDAADTILEDYGTPASWTALTADQKIVRLNQGARYIDGVYGRYAKGSGKTDCAQALLWPRLDVYVDACEVDSGTVPEAIQIASVLAAAEASKGVVELFPVATSQERSLRRELTQIGPLKVEEEWTGAGASSSSPPRISVVDAIIRSSRLFDFTRSGALLRG